MGKTRRWALIGEKASKKILICKGSHLEILGTDWAFMRLAFLQPKPHNIMLIF